MIFTVGSLPGARARLPLFVLGVLGCGGPGSIAPEGLRPIERKQVEQWIESIRADSPRLITVRPWRYQNRNGAAAGRARLRLAPPDSLRFDYRGPLGTSGAAAVVGDRALWVTPEDDDFTALVEVAPIFWATLSQPLDPPEGVRFMGLANDHQRVWQYAVGGDTLTFVLDRNPVERVRSEIRRDGKTFVLGVLDLDPATGLPQKAVVEFPGEPARFTLNVQAVETGVSFDGDVWAEP